MKKGSKATRPYRRIKPLAGNQYVTKAFTVKPTTWSKLDYYANKLNFNNSALVRYALDSLFIVLDALDDKNTSREELLDKASEALGVDVEGSIEQE